MSEQQLSEFVDELRSLVADQKTRIASAKEEEQRAEIQREEKATAVFADAQTLVAEIISDAASLGMKVQTGRDRNLSYYRYVLLDGVLDLGDWGDPRFRWSLQKADGKQLPRPKWAEKDGADLTLDFVKTLFRRLASGELEADSAPKG